MLRKPTMYNELLELQRELDKTIKHNRERTSLDSMLCLDIAFNEWLMSTPLTPMTWRSKPYEPEIELLNVADVLFYLCQLLNRRKDEEFIDTYSFTCKLCGENTHIYNFKTSLWDCDIGKLVKSIVSLIKLRGFTEEEVMDCYWTKYIRNMGKYKEV